MRIGQERDKRITEEERVDMEKEERIEIPKPQGHCCFACGTANPMGLKLQFYVSGDAVCTDITLGKYHEGWENMAHGGILSTLLDEVMSWTVIYGRRTFFVTRKMDVKYIRPVIIGTPLTVKGRITDAPDSRRIRARAEIFDDHEILLVRSTGEFVVLPEEKLTMVPDGLKKDMNELFDALKRTHKEVSKI